MIDCSFYVFAISGKCKGIFANVYADVLCNVYIAYNVYMEPTHIVYDFKAISIHTEFSSQFPLEHGWLNNIN